MKHLLLTIDIGNTHTVAGTFDLPRSSELGKPEPLRSVRFRTDAHATSDEYRLLLTQLLGEDWSRIERVVFASVVPALETVVISACSPIPALAIRAQTRREFELDLPYPDQLGADRLANAAGALTLEKGPMLICDGGTATTFCLIDARPAYLGGAIVPGLEISRQALISRAAKLFSVEMIAPPSALGNTTETQLQSGVLLGYEALIEGLTDRIISDARKTHPSLQGQDIRLIATGGCTRMLKLSSRWKSLPHLTLTGLRRYAELTL